MKGLTKIITASALGLGLSVLFGEDKQDDKL